MATKQIAWITQGPAAGKIVQLPNADFEKAVKAGWAVHFKYAAQNAPNREAKNEAAERYFSQLPGYQTRELRATGSSAAEPAAGSVAESTAGEAPQKSKPGRKPKAAASDSDGTVPNSTGKPEK